MNYILALATGLSVGTTKEITLKACGRAIATVVHVAEITWTPFPQRSQSKISIGTEAMSQREGETTL